MDTFDYILDKWGHHWAKRDTVMRKCIDAATRLAIFLFWMATGLHQRAIAAFFDVSDSSVSLIINRLVYVFR